MLESLILPVGIIFFVGYICYKLGLAKHIPKAISILKQLGRNIKL